MAEKKALHYRALIEIGKILSVVLVLGGFVRYFWPVFADTLNVASADSVQELAAEVDTLAMALNLLQQGRDGEKLTIALLLADPDEKARIKDALSQERITGIRLNADSVIQRLLYK